MKVGKVSWAAEACPHSEGAAYKRQGREVVACLRDWRMGSYSAMRDRDNRTRTGAKDPWGREAMASCTAASGRDRLTWTQSQVVARWPKLAKDSCKRRGVPGMPGTGLTGAMGRQALFDMLALKPYWGKPAVRNFRGGDGNGGIIRSPLSAIALPDFQAGVNDIAGGTSNSASVMFRGAALGSAELNRD